MLFGEACLIIKARALSHTVPRPAYLVHGHLCGAVEELPGFGVFDLLLLRQPRLGLPLGLARDADEEAVAGVAAADHEVLVKLLGGK